MKWWNRKGLTPRQSGLLPTFFTLLSPIPRLPLEKKKVRVLPPSSFSFLGFRSHSQKYDIRSSKYLPKVNNYVKDEHRENNVLFGILHLPFSSFSCQCRLLLLFDPKQLLGMGMHYLNDPLCFSQSGGCRRLINLTCLLFPVRSDTHCIFKTCIKTPTLFFFFTIPCTFCSPNQNKHSFHQPSDYHTNRPDCDICKWTKYGAMICLHNECGLCLTVIRFTTAYICTIVNGHEDDGILDWLACLINILGRASSFNLNREVDEYIIFWVLNWCNSRI